MKMKAFLPVIVNFVRVFLGYFILCILCYGFFWIFVVIGYIACSTRSLGMTHTTPRPPGVVVCVIPWGLLTNHCLCFQPGGSVSGPIPSDGQGSGSELNYWRPQGQPGWSGGSMQQ